MPLFRGVLLFVLIGCSRLWAMDAVVSHTVFFRTDSSLNGKFTPEVALYWQINPHTVHFVTNAEKKIVAHIRTDIFFTNDSGGASEDHYVLTTFPRSSVQDLMRHNILELKKYALSPGMVHVKMILTDLADSLHPFVYKDTFTIQKNTDPYFFSGVELLDTFFISDISTPFMKMGRQLVPECANFLDEPKRQLHFYVETYHRDLNARQYLPLVQKIFVSRLENDDIAGKYTVRDTITVLQPVHGFAGTIPIGRLVSGNYLLQAELENSRHEILATQSLFFQRLNRRPDIIKEDTAKKDFFADTGVEKVTIINLKKTFIAKYSLGEIKGILKMMLPFSDPAGVTAIKNFLKKPDETYMRYYVYNFFQAQNHDNPEKAFKEFSIKIIEVNKLYNTHSTLGYETERGFIYLRYGKPTDIISVENEQGCLPYEIWTYDALMQQNHKEITDAVFLFYKPTIEAYNFQLLHSNVEGEVQNPSWRSFLYKGGGSSGGSDPRAEQYIGSK